MAIEYMKLDGETVGIDTVSRKILSGKHKGKTQTQVAQELKSRPAAPKADPVVDSKVREMFGEAAAYLNHPELGPILRRAAAEGWVESRLAGALQQTAYWRTTGDQARKWEILRRLDPASATKQIEQQMMGVVDLARQSGVNLSQKEYYDLSVAALKDGLSSTQIRERMMSSVAGKPGGFDTAVTQQYGYLGAFLDNPEVSGLLQRGAREGWSQQRLETELQRTQFWRQTTDSQRRFQAAMEQSPGDAQQAVQQRAAEMQTLAQELGVQVDDARLRAMATDSLQYGWNSAQIRSALSKEFDYKGGEGGLAGQSARRVKELAGEYLVPISDQAMEKWTEQMVSGVADEESYRAYLVEQAKSMFPGMAGALDKGITVAQYADPYKQMAARELELAPESIDLMDPRYRRMLDQRDSQGNRVSMTLSESAEYLRKMPEWQKTRGANEKAATLTENILRTFGAVA